METQQPSLGREAVREQLPKAHDLLWDLDRFALYGPEVRPAHPLLAWITTLQPSEFQRLHSILSDIPSKPTLERFMHGLPSPPPSKRHDAIVSFLIEKEGRNEALSYIRSMHFKEAEVDTGMESRVHIERPGPFRKEQVQQLMQTNLARIIEQHYGHSRTDNSTRRLLDMDVCWDLSPSLRTLHGDALRSESNARRFHEHYERKEHGFDRVVQAGPRTLLNILKQRSSPIDTVLLGSALQSTSASDQEVADTLLELITHVLTEDGIAIAITHDTAPDTGSRAHFLGRLGMQAHRPSDDIQKLLSTQGIRTRVLRASHLLRSKTSDGDAILRDFLRFDARGATPRKEVIDGYIHYLRTHCNATYRDTFCFVIAYKTGKAEAVMSSVDRTTNAASEIRRSAQSAVSTRISPEKEKLFASRLSNPWVQGSTR